MITGDVDGFVNNLMKEVEQKWEKFQETLSKGYAVFYSPVRMNPDLMIIGFNPGGDQKAFDRNRDRNPPPIHEYIKEDYRIANRMRKLFESMNCLETLKNSVKLNLIFFRSKDTEEWNKIDVTIRKELSTFCKDKVKLIIETLRPRIVLAEGITTYRVLKNEVLFGKACEKVIPHKNGGKIIHIMTNFSDFNLTLIGIRHPTGSRPNPSDSEWKMIGDKLSVLLRNRVPSDEY